MSAITYNGKRYEEADLKRVLKISNTACQLAPAFTAGIDWSGNPWALPGDESDLDKLAQRSFDAAAAFVAREEEMLAKLKTPDEPAVKVGGTD